MLSALSGELVRPATAADTKKAQACFSGFLASWGIAWISCLGARDAISRTLFQFLSEVSVGALQLFGARGSRTSQ